MTPGMEEPEAEDGVRAAIAIPTRLAQQVRRLRTRPLLALPRDKLSDPGSSAGADGTKAPALQEGESNP
jgi:hypothetical protein